MSDDDQDYDLPISEIKLRIEMFKHMEKQAAKIAELQAERLRLKKELKILQGKK